MRALDALPRIAELSLQAARQVGALALSAARTAAAPLLERHRSGEDRSGWTRNWEPPSSRPVGEPPPPPSAPRPRAAAAPPAPTAQAPTPAPNPAPMPADPPAPASRPAPPPPAHVDREAVVVAESADTGAADGAGAQIRIDEPWEGYSRLTAKDVTAQLATADPATLAVVRLYEAANRNRSTVLAAIDRRLTTAKD
jgi:hypothetical protein